MPEQIEQDEAVNLGQAEIEREIAWGCRLLARPSVPASPVEHHAFQSACAPDRAGS